MRLTSVILASILMFAAFSRAQETAMQEGTIQPSGLAPGDQLTVHMYDFPETGGSVQVRVAPDGSVFLPYAGRIQALGLSPEQLAQVIIETLQKREIVKRPNVTVEVVSAVNMTVNVLGQVQTPHAIPLYAPASLSYVLAQVGGITGMADHHLTILHRGDQLPTSVEYEPDTPSSAALNTMVQPGDIVTVSNRGVYFVGGEVNRPGVYPLGGILTSGASNNGLGLEKNVTLLQALAQAGGITQIAARSKMHILRTIDGKRVDIPVDQVKLSKGEVADPILHPNDIIYIPPSYFRQQTNNIFSTALSSLYAVTQIRSVTQ